MPHHPTLRAILLGGFLAGALDILAAFTQAALRGGSPLRVLERIASGVMGIEAIGAGVDVALLGLTLHFIIAYGAATLYVLAAQILPALATRWRSFGPLYGVTVWAMMTFVIVPLSAVPGTPRRLPINLAIGILIHVLCVGLPIGWAARKR